MVRKVPIEYENPIDNIILNFVQISLPYLYYLKLTPNILTTISFLFGLVTSGAFYLDYKWLSALSWMISYFFDCSDGSFARTYHMTSEWGDWYDHISDIVKFSILAYVMYIKDRSRLISYLPIIMISLALSTVHLSCYHNYYISDLNGDHQYSQSFLKNLSKICQCDNNTNILRYLRYFGTGTFVTLIAILLIM